MKTDCHMYHNYLGRARLFWHCLDCGLEWREGDGVAEPNCPRCESRRSKLTAIQTTTLLLADRDRWRRDAGRAARVALALRAFREAVNKWWRKPSVPPRSALVEALDERVRRVLREEEGTNGPTTEAPHT